MNRRSFLRRSLSALAALPFLKSLPTFASTPARRPLTLGQIFQASWKDCVEVHRPHSGLTRLEAEGRLRYCSPCMPAGEPYEAAVVIIPVVWSGEDERLNRTETSRIDFVAQLIDNTLCSHDDLFVERLGNRRALVSKNYHYQLGAVQKLDNSDAYVVKVFTAVFFY